MPPISAKFSKCLQVQQNFQMPPISAKFLVICFSNISDFCHFYVDSWQENHNKTLKSTGPQDVHPKVYGTPDVGIFSMGEFILLIKRLVQSHTSINQPICLLLMSEILNRRGLVKFKPFIKTFTK